MKKNLLKTIFYTLFYFAIAYFLLYLSFVLDDFLDDFKASDNLDRVNYLCLRFSRYALFFVQGICVFVGLLFPFEYIKSFKERADY